jgi:hypothetical protein
MSYRVAHGITSQKTPFYMKRRQSTVDRKCRNTFRCYTRSVRAVNFVTLEYMPERVLNVTDIKASLSMIAAVRILFVFISVAGMKPSPLLLQPFIVLVLG